MKKLYGGLLVIFAFLGGASFGQIETPTETTTSWDDTLMTLRRKYVTSPTHEARYQEGKALETKIAEAVGDSEKTHMAGFVGYYSEDPQLLKLLTIQQNQRLIEQNERIIKLLEAQAKKK